MDRKLRMQIAAHEAQLDRLKQRTEDALAEDRRTIEVAPESPLLALVIVFLLVACLLGASLLLAAK
jgi:hypothetical protein